MDSRNSNDQAFDPQLAYTIAAGFVAALHHGLVPRCVSTASDACASEIPLFPDDVLRESPLHLAAAGSFYSAARVDRMIEQGLWSLEVVLAPIVMTTILQDFDFETPPPRPELSRAHLALWAELCLTCVWPEGDEAPLSDAYINRGEELSAHTEIGQLISRLALLTGWNSQELRARVDGAIRADITLLLSHWEAVRAIAEHIIETGSLSDAEAARLGQQVLDGKFADNAPWRGLMAFQRDQIRAERSMQDASANLRPAFGAIMDGFEEETSRSASAEEVFQSLPQTFWDEAAEAIRSNEAARWLQTEAPPQPAALGGASSLCKAARLFLGLYNGGYIFWDADWNFEEILPSRYSLLPLAWLDQPGRYLRPAQRQRYLDDADWEIQSIFAGEIADRLAASASDGTGEIPFPAPSLVPLVEDGGASLRLTTLSESDHVIEERLQMCWAKSCAILRGNWSDVLRLTQLISDTGVPSIEQVLAVAGPIRGGRVAGDPVTALIFEQMRERIAADDQRAVEEKSMEAS